ncbi:nucleotidyltransferase family protein [Desulfospira joergensenii]|uniref:nucleotidyltransferase family protein n=1 Tax=Desulfospira joergensenii TaxID=53329 RepID=UPI0003B38CC7|nr:nucleotidyltransferase family protein [Desulfospira joergensenii]
MDVLLLVGGKGTRLKSVVKDRPKPMAEINGRPFLDKLIEYAASFGHNRFILCAGHMWEYLADYYRYSDLPYKMVFSIEKSALGTGGAVRKAEKHILTEDFLVMNGDSFCPVDLETFKAFHHRNKSEVSVAVTKSKDIKDYGLIGFDDSYRINNFEEKKESPEEGFINAGVYLFNKRVLKRIPKNLKCSLEKNIFPSIAGENFFAYPVDSRVLDIGTPIRYDLARKYFSR